MNLRVAVLLFYIFQFIHGQPDYLGFISIDCGIPLNSTYQDPSTNILYVSDYGFIGPGENRNISSDYIKQSLGKGYFNVRFFPHGSRNCYTLRSLVARNKYLVRASFYYGNYDGLNKPPVFDLYLGSNYWHEVTFGDARSVNWMDIIVVSPTDYLQVCLVNKGSGTPFISGLDLRPLKTTLYPMVNASQSLVLINSNRFHLGPADNSIVRYPSDPRDRIWSTYDAIPNCIEISTTSHMQDYLSGLYDVPSSIMQTAATVNSSRIDFWWDPSDPSVDISSKYFFIFYFAELQNLPSNDIRQFDIIVNNKTWNTEPYTLTFLLVNYLSGVVHGMANYSVSLVSAKNATLPTILNAMEIYLVNPITEVATDPGDATSTSRPLTWEQRLQIALDAAQGLEYLHIACKPALIHRDVKSRNILLATDFVAKIADFGLTMVFGDSKTHITTKPAGTMGYLDPEYVMAVMHDIGSLLASSVFRAVALFCQY